MRGHKIFAKKGAGPLRGRELFSTLVPANVPGDGTDIRLKAGRTASKSCRARPDRCARIIYPYVYALAALLLFQDFYNWGEAVSRINALTEGRIGQLFNGIVITCSLGRGITFALSRSSPFSFFLVRAFPIFVVQPSFYFTMLRSLHLLLSVSLFSSRLSIVALCSRVLSFLPLFRLCYFAFIVFLAVLLPSVFRHCCLLIVLYYIKLLFISMGINFATS